MTLITAAKDLALKVNYSIMCNGGKVGYVVFGQTVPTAKNKVKVESCRYTFSINWQGPPEDATKGQQRLADGILAYLQDDLKGNCQLVPVVRAETQVERAVAEQTARMLAAAKASGMTKQQLKAMKAAAGS